MGELLGFVPIENENENDASNNNENTSNNNENENDASNNNENTSNNNENTITPLTRLETYLAKIAGEDITAPEARTRLEAYLAKIAEEDVEVPEPRTRIEYYLNKIAGNGGTSNFSLATVQIKDLSGKLPFASGPCINEVEDWAYSTPAAAIGTNEFCSNTVILYKGIAEIIIRDAYNSSAHVDVTVTGDIEEIEGVIVIRGDGTITINSVTL